MRSRQKWGFREAARRLGCSWRLVQKESKPGGVLSGFVLPPEQWIEEPVTMFRKHYVQTPFGPEYTRTTEEPSEKAVWKGIDAKKLLELHPEQFQAMLKLRWLDAHESELFAFFGAGQYAPDGPPPSSRVLKLHQWLKGEGVNESVRDAWLASVPARQKKWKALMAETADAQAKWETKQATDRAAAKDAAAQAEDERRRGKQHRRLKRPARAARVAAQVSEIARQIRDMMIGGDK